jgi:hypothetical protein
MNEVMSVAIGFILVTINSYAAYRKKVLLLTIQHVFDSDDLFRRHNGGGCVQLSSCSRCVLFFQRY